MLRLTDIGKSREGRMVLEGVSFALAAGETVCLLGPSGCGKTTLLSIAAGLEVPDSGNVRCDARKGAIGYLFQNRELLPWRTVLENAALGCEFSGVDAATAQERARAVLEKLGLEDALHLYPRQISGGMKQRTALAQVLACAPDLLLLDEPLSGQDPTMRMQAARVIKRCILEKNAAALVVTHSIEEALFLADRIVILGANPARVKADLHMDRLRGAPDPFGHVLHAFTRSNPEDRHDLAA